MPCPHYDIKIVQRSNRQSAVAAAAYQSGDKLFSEYDQLQKYYAHKGGITQTEIILPPHAPPTYADRNTLWNAAEATEKQWNSQLARRIVLALPRELSSEQHTDLLRDYCWEFFVSKGMIADIAIHDKGDGNPHAHILLTMRAMDESGKWLPKSRKVYDLDKNGERIRLPSGNWKSHKEDTVDWNDQSKAEIWRQGWADTTNRYLEASQCPYRLDLRSYDRQGNEKIPTVHMGASVSQMEKRGIQTNIGNLNRDIQTANRLMQSILQTIRHLKDWITDLKEKKQAVMEALTEKKEPPLPDLLAQYMELRQKERSGWSTKAQLKSSVTDFEKISHTLEYLRSRGITTVETLDRHLEAVSSQTDAIRQNRKTKENRIKGIDTMLRHIQSYEAHKPIHAEYSAIHWKGKQQKFAEVHKEELDAYLTAIRYLKKHLGGNTYDRQELKQERTRLVGELNAGQNKLQALQDEVKKLRDVRHCIRQILEPKEPEEKESIRQKLKEHQERISREQIAKRQPAPTNRKQDMER